MHDALVSSSVLAQQWWDGHMEGWAMGGWGWIMMGLTMLVFWVVVIGLVVWLVRSTTQDRRPRDRGLPEDRARSILAERYARGEIDTEEYERRLDALR